MILNVSFFSIQSVIYRIDFFACVSSSPSVVWVLLTSYGLHFSHVSFSVCCSVPLDYLWHLFLLTFLFTRPAIHSSLSAIYDIIFSYLSSSLSGVDPVGFLQHLFFTYVSSVCRFVLSFSWHHFFCLCFFLPVCCCFSHSYRYYMYLFFTLISFSASCFVPLSYLLTYSCLCFCLSVISPSWLFTAFIFHHLSVFCLFTYLFLLAFPPLWLVSCPSQLFMAFIFLLRLLISYVSLGFLRTYPCSRFHLSVCCFVPLGSRPEASVQHVWEQVTFGLMTSE